MPLIVVDIGNTNITVGYYDTERSPQRRWAIDSRPSRTSDEFRLLLRQLVHECPEFGTARSALIASVVPSITPDFSAALRAVAPEAKITELTAQTPLPLRNAYPVPEEVGADRLANAVGALKLHGAPVIVVDIGTATTFDIVDAEPCYRGGLILPGPRLAAETLHLRTARLPLISPRRTEKIIASNTADSIKAGLFWGTVGSIDYLIGRIAEEAGFESYTGIATGGMAREFVACCERLQHYDPELTLRGLLEIAKFNNI